MSREYNSFELEVQQLRDKYWRGKFVTPKRRHAVFTRWQQKVDACTYYDRFEQADRGLTHWDGERWRCDLEDSPNTQRCLADLVMRPTSGFFVIALWSGRPDLTLEGFILDHESALYEPMGFIRDFAYRKVAAAQRVLSEWAPMSHEAIRTTEDLDSKVHELFAIVEQDRDRGRLLDEGVQAKVLPRMVSRV